MAVAGPDPQATKTVAVMRQFYPLACTAGDALWKWAECHDTMTGFDHVLACVTDARTMAERARAQIPATEAPSDSSCASSLELRSRVFVKLTAVYFEDLATWLTARRASLTGPLKAKSLHEIDDDKLKEGMPEEWDAKYKATESMLSFGIVNNEDCTKQLYRCGLTDEDVCGVQKVASRLGISCKPSAWDTRNPASWLYDRKTHERVQ